MILKVALNRFSLQDVQTVSRQPSFLGWRLILRLISNRSHFAMPMMRDKSNFFLRFRFFMSWITSNTWLADNEESLRLPLSWFCQCKSIGRILRTASTCMSKNLSSHLLANIHFQPSPSLFKINYSLYNVTIEIFWWKTILLGSTVWNQPPIWDDVRRIMTHRNRIKFDAT